MAQMTHCSGCQKHYFRHEAACPHCGGTGRTGPVRAFVRQAKMGGLMLFTALTTTACYGTPAMIEGPSGVRPPGVEQPERKVPSMAGVAHAFLTQKGGKVAKRNVFLGTAQLQGKTLTLLDAAGVALFTLEVEDEVALQPADGVQETIPLSGMAALTLSVTYEDGPSFVVESLTEVSEGYLQLSRLEDARIGGALRLESEGQVFDLYFLAER